MSSTTFTVVMAGLGSALVLLLAVRAWQRPAPDAAGLQEPPADRNVVYRPPPPRESLTISEVAVAVATGLWLFVLSVGAVGAVVFVILARASQS